MGCGPRSCPRQYFSEAGVPTRRKAYPIDIGNFLSGARRRRQPYATKMDRSLVRATKLLASVLGVITNDVDKLTELLDQPRYTGTNRLVPTNYRQLLFKPPLNIVWDDLGMCSPDIVGNYLQLDAKLSEFARSQVYAVDIMQNELRVIADILVLLDQELQSDAARHNNLLLETMQQD